MIEKVQKLYEYFFPCIVMECAQLNLLEFSMAKSLKWKYEECLEVFKNIENILSKLS
jgi:hypothetical protein